MTLIKELKSVMKGKDDDLLEFIECFINNDPEIMFNEKANEIYKELRKLVVPFSLLIPLYPADFLKILINMKNKELKAFIEKLEINYIQQAQQQDQDLGLNDLRGKRIPEKTVKLITKKRPYKISIQLNKEILPYYLNFENLKDIDNYLRKVGVFYERTSSKKFKRILEDVKKQDIFQIAVYYNFITDYTRDMTKFGITRSVTKPLSLKRTGIDSKEKIDNLLLWLNEEGLNLASIHPSIEYAFNTKSSHFFFYVLFPEK